MKIFNKKSVGGFEWIFASIALIIALGIVTYGTFTASLPNIGERSLAVSKSLEGGLNIPKTVESIMAQLNSEANLGYENHKVFALDSYCNDTFDADGDGITQESTNYKNKLIAANPNLKTPKSGEFNHFTAREEVKCYATEEEFMNYYEEAFNKEYTSFKSTKWENLNLDFSSVDYASQVVKEVNAVKKYFNLLKTTGGFTIPITMKDKNGIKNIGSFNVKPNFKLEIQNPENRPFDGHEVCIFAADCGATCKDALERNPGSDLKIVENAVPMLRCEAYYDCKEPLDQFGKPFSCSKESGTATSNPILCKGQCLQFCSASSGRVDDADASTKCTKYSCSNYWSCSDANVCGCPDPSNPSFNNACGGLDCDTLNCDSDSEFENEKKITTQCLDSCGKYGGCSSTKLCACDSGLSSCQGSCYCNPQEWKSTGGCGNKREDGIQCEWNGIPQKREYNPSTCSSPDYRCELQPVEVCQLPCTPYECAGTCEAYDENCDIIPADDCC